MLLHHHLDDQLVVSPLQAVDRRGALMELVQALADSGRVADRDALLSLAQGKALTSTVIDEGVAVSRLTGVPVLRSLENLVLGIGLSPQGVDFDAWGGRPVRVVFFLAQAEEDLTRYAEALSRIFLPADRARRVPGESAGGSVPRGDRRGLDWPRRIARGRADPAGRAARCGPLTRERDRRP